MDYKVIWSDMAIEDLRSIFDHLSEHQPQAATGVLTKIIERVETLDRFPSAGDVYRKQGPIRQVFSGVYRIFYHVDEGQKRVEILAVRHGSRRNPRLPRV